jgi:hypothetical protein
MAIFTATNIIGMNTAMFTSLSIASTTATEFSFNSIGDLVRLFSSAASPFVYTAGYPSADTVEPMEIDVTGVSQATRAPISSSAMDILRKVQ